MEMLNFIKILTTAGVAQSIKALLRMRKVGC